MCIQSNRPRRTPVFGCSACGRLTHPEQEQRDRVPPSRRIAQKGYKIEPVIIYQDNQSCMALVERGRSGAERTRHIQIRYFWVKERVVTGEVRVEYLRSEDMYANVLTKPLQGSQFQRERETGSQGGPRSRERIKGAGGRCTAPFENT